VELRKLGRQGLEVSALGLGCMGMTFAYKGGADEAECEATLAEAVDTGVSRDKVCLATKFGFDIANLKPGQSWALDSRPAHIREVVEQSLQRLQTDRIDLLYQHRVDPNVPIEEVVGAMADLVRQGKVRYLGLSEASAATLRRAHAVHPISALQSEYSLWERNVEREVLPACRELGVGLVPYSPLGRGFLAGNATRAEELPEGDFRRAQPRIQGENFDANRKLVARVEELAQRVGATPAQIALAWLLAQGPDIVPIFGTTRRARLRENLAAANVRLAACDLFLLDQVFAPGNTAGERYNAASLATLDRTRA
jgi:aryl-alcohol dehydrogenase-like predicted oxidoreductase